MAPTGPLGSKALMAPILHIYAGAFIYGPAALEKNRLGACYCQASSDVWQVLIVGVFLESYLLGGVGSSGGAFRTGVEDDVSWTPHLSQCIGYLTS